MFILIIKIKVLLTIIWLAAQLAIFTSLRVLLSTLQELMSMYIIIKYLGLHFSKPYIEYFLKSLLHYIRYIRFYFIIKTKSLYFYLLYLIRFTIVAFLERLIDLIHKILKWYLDLKVNLSIINFVLKKYNINMVDLIRLACNTIVNLRVLSQPFLLFLLLNVIINYFTNDNISTYICNLAHISIFDFLFLWKIINCTSIIKNINFLVIHILQVYMFISLVLWFVVF